MRATAAAAPRERPERKGTASIPPIIYIQADGARQLVRAAAGVSLMEAALRAGVPGIDAKCRGTEASADRER